MSRRLRGRHPETCRRLYAASNLMVLAFICFASRSVLDLLGKSLGRIVSSSDVFDYDSTEDVVLDALDALNAYNVLEGNGFGLIAEGDSREMLAVAPLDIPRDQL
ncbi:Hypothetical predicted protein [Lecanosticta acicola]|uniref:Uncharacterized protein n=1 Tax=Lecanosticta acicola TaxID=111012 RepID=A0AAI8YU05_9PEZI|nr:Hypothetical predicted protein [Lecanosticta acicola]